MRDLRTPDGIDPSKSGKVGGTVLRGWPFGLGGLALVLGIALSGVLGTDADVSASGAAAELVVEGPRRMRTGGVFETVFVVHAKRDIRDLTLLVDEHLWRGMTINTLLPDPSEHGFRDGAFEFRFGELRSGDTLLIKVDGQVNPLLLPAANDGTVSVADGATVLVSADLAMELLP
jgi:hypothetical protein